MTGTGTRRVAKGIANRKQKGPIVAEDQGSHLDHQYSKTSLTGDPRFRSVGAPLRHKLLPG